VDQLYVLRAFVAVAQHRSFSKAATVLGVSTGSISKAIAKLETSLRTRLLHRTTRSVTVTEDAQSYYLSCRRLLDELDEANRRVTREREVESGRLRLAVHPIVMGDAFFAFLASYRAMAPGVHLSVSVREGSVNLYDGRFDMAILPHDQMETSAVIRRTLLSSPRVLVACAQYLAQRGAPLAASDLERHFLLVPPNTLQRNGGALELVENGERVTVSPASSMDGNDVLLRAAALAGAGIAQLPEAMIRDDVANGKLVRVLPHCSGAGNPIEVGLFYPHRKLLPARFRIFVDCCTEFFQIRTHAATMSSPAPVRAISTNACMALDT
jgi:DNA-binding transcriptional LysR family regulator